MMALDRRNDEKPEYDDGKLSPRAHRELRIFHIYLQGIEDVQEVLDEWTLYPPRPDPNA